MAIILDETKRITVGELKTPIIDPVKIYAVKNRDWFEITDLVIPEGGTVGQVLTKLSGDDYDLEWADGSVGSDPVYGAGMLSSDGATVTPRTITAGTGISVTNGNGVSANPTIAIGIHSHAAEYITAGTFSSSGSGDFVFPELLTILGNLVLEHNYLTVNFDRNPTTGTVYSLDMEEQTPIQKYDLEANITINFGFDPPSDRSSIYYFIFKQDIVGGRTVTWNTSGTDVKWQAGSWAGVDSAASSITKVTIIWDGVDYLGSREVGFA